jgi:hypothetical protein
METKTYEEYKAEIEQWDWAKIKADAIKNPQSKDGDGNDIGMEFLGTVFALAPSGKYYMPWTSNQTEKDVTEDEKFYKALDDVAEAHGMFIENGEGDPCDLFASVVIESTK